MKKPLLSELTLREKIGQMGNYRNWDIVDKIRNNHKDLPLIGSIWAMGALDMKVINMADESTGEKIPAKSQWEFLHEFNKQTKIPTILAMDSTKGIKGAFYDLTTVSDSPTVGATGSEELSYKLGVCKANQLKCAGAQWLWGPEEDLASRNSAVNLGRKFSDNPDLVIKLANAQNKGIQSVNVAATAKHFPGEDELEYRDPHVSASMLHISVEDWWEKQGRVFKEIFDDGVYSVMVGHQSFPACDNTKINGNYVPSTASYKVVTELLKGEMGFDGVVITDAIGMHSLMDMFGDHIRISIECIKAGCDVILGAQGEFIDGVEQAVLNGEIPMSRIDDACQRILDMKEKIGVFDAPLEEMNKDEIVSECNNLTQEISKKSLSLVCDNNQLLPLNPEKHKNFTIVYSGYGQGIFESLEFMKDELLKHGAKRVNIVQGLKTRPDAEKCSSESDIMLYVAHIGCHQPRGGSTFQDDEFLTFYHTTVGNQKGKRIGVSIGSPFVYFDYYEDFDCFVNAYNSTEATQRSFIKAIFGEIPFEGCHPFKLIPDGFKVTY